MCHDEWNRSRSLARLDQFGELRQDDTIWVDSTMLALVSRLRRTKHTTHLCVGLKQREEDSNALQVPFDIGIGVGRQCTGKLIRLQLIEVDVRQREQY